MALRSSRKPQVSIKSQSWEIWNFDVAQCAFWGFWGSGGGWEVVERYQRWEGHRLDVLAKTPGLYKVPKLRYGIYIISYVVSKLPILALLGHISGIVISLNFNPKSFLKLLDPYIYNFGWLFLGIHNEVSGQLIWYGMTPSSSFYQCYFCIILNRAKFLLGWILPSSGGAILRLAPADS